MYFIQNVQDKSESFGSYLLKGLLALPVSYRKAILKCGKIIESQKPVMWSSELSDGFCV